MWRLGAAPAHLSSSEKAAKLASNFNALKDNLLMAPWRLGNDILLHIRHDSLWAQRSTSVIVGLICLAAFYYCLRVWLGKLVAALAAALLISTPLFLLASRSGTPRVMYFWPIVPVAAYVYLWRTKRLKRGLASLVVSLVISLYTPGLVWPLFLLLIFKWRRLAALSQELGRRATAFALILTLVLMAPLIFNLVTHSGLIKDYFLIPHHFASAIEILKRWVWAALSLVVKSPSHQELILGQTAILSGAQIGLALFGAYALLARLRQPLYLIIVALGLITFLSGFDNNYYFLEAAVLPLIILAGFGLRFLYLEWQHTFPRNPLPRYFAYGVMAALIIINLVFTIRYSLIAWPLA